MNLFDNLDDLGLDKGTKQHIHLTLYDSELEILDALARRHNTSRAAVLGALLKRIGTRANLSTEVPVAQKPGRRSRRRLQS